MQEMMNPISTALQIYRQMDQNHHKHFGAPLENLTYKYERPCQNNTLSIRLETSQIISMEEIIGDRTPIFIFLKATIKRAYDGLYRSEATLRIIEGRM